jgi:hypothetical protein
VQTGAYQLLATVDLTGARDLNQVNNTAAASVKIARPFVQLSAQPFAAPSFVGTRPSTVKLNLMNTGNISAAGLSSVQFLASTDGTIADATPLATVPLRFNIGPGKPAVLIERLSLPAGLAAGNYFLLALLDPANVLKQPFPTLDLVLSSSTFAVS